MYGSGFSDGSGFSAEGFTASITKVSPTDPKMSPSMRRRLMNADCEVDFVFIDGLELEQTWRKARQPEGTGASRFSCWSFYLNDVSVGFGFGLDDVGIGTCVAVESPDPVVIECVRS
jgi:hypothetical protein